MSARPLVTLKPRKAQPFFNRHPWVFDTAIAKVSDTPADGAEVLVQSHEGKPIGLGLFNSNSHIRVRLYQWNVEQAIDTSFWRERLTAAIDLRRRLMGPHQPDTGRRLVFSEADGISGLTVDQYGPWLMVQFTSLALWQRREELLALLREMVNPRGIVARTEKGIRAAEGLELSDGLLWGESPPAEFEIRDGAVTYSLDLNAGQKTGFFLDQRHNRRLLSGLCAGQHVLDLFCYSGGFGLTALVEGNASRVTAVDVSETALALVRKNAAANGVADRVETLKSDGFEALEAFAEAGKTFPSIVLDPPKLARNRQSLDQAMRGYLSLNQLALQTLEPGGWLVTCSCSGLVTREMFCDVLSRAAIQAGRRLTIVHSSGAAQDHPVTPHCPENEYLKCLLCAVE